MRKAYTWMVCTVLLCSGSAFGQNFVTIGNGTSSTGTYDTGPTPFGTYYHDDRTQMLYLASEINASGGFGGDILSVGFEVATSTGYAMGSFNLKIKTTTATSLSTFETGATTVYTSASQSLTSGWNDFMLTTPFNWDGVSNLIVEICFDNAAFNFSGNETVYYTPTNFTSVYSYYCDSWCNTGGGCFNTSTSTFYQYQNRVNTRFEFTPPVVNDAGIAAIDTPYVPSCTLADKLYITLGNNGQGDLTSANVNWSVNGVNQTALNWTGLVSAQGGTAGPIFVGNYSFSAGDIVKVWTSMPNGVPDSANTNDTARFIPNVSLSGMYTIDPAGSGASNFLSFTDAVDALTQYGVCGAVTFDVADATFNEQIQIGEIIGASATNTVTFQSASGDSALCILEFTTTGSADNYVIDFATGASNISFHDMTIRNLGNSFNARVINFSGNSDHIAIEGSRISNNYTTTTSANVALIYKNGPACNDCSFEGNTLLRGSYGIYWYGNISTYDMNAVFNGNEFVNQYYEGMYTYYQEGMKITHNEITSNSTYTFGYGILSYYNNGIPEVVDNYIHSAPGSYWPRYGMYFSDFQGDLNSYGKIQSNRISIGDPSYVSTYYGIYLSQSFFAEVANNSILLKAGTTSSYGSYFTGGGFNFVYNNIFVNDGTGYGIYATGTPIYDSDHNCVYSNGNYGYFGTPYQTLSAWQAGTNMDANSMSLTNIYVDSVSLKVCTDSLDGAGIALTGAYMWDFENDPRDANTPDIGADEFMAVSNFDMLDTTAVCSGDTLWLEAFYFDSVVWNSSVVGSTFMVTAPATYTVDAYSVCGHATDQIVVLPQEDADLGVSNNICFNGSTMLDPQVSDGTYNWSTGEMTQSITVDAPGSYTVTVTDRFGCPSTATTNVTQSMPVNLDEEIRFCEGGAATLDANMPGTYAWSDGQTSQSISVTTSGTYSVEVTDPFNCISSDTTQVVEVLNPIAGFTNAVTFMTSTFTNTSQNATSYLWDFGDGTTSTDSDPVHVFPWPGGTFTVVLTASNECGSSSDTLTVRADETTTSIQELGNDVSYNVYPNPNNGTFTLEVNGTSADDIELEIVDLQGKLILNRNYGILSGGMRETVQLEGVAHGMYVVKLRMGDRVATQLLTVQ